MNLEDLRSELTAGIGRGDLSQSLLNSWINSGVERVCRSHGFLELETAVTLQVSQGPVSLPTGLQHINLLLYLSGTDTYPVAWKSVSDFYRRFPLVDSVPEQGEPEMFYRLANTVIMQPFPSTGSYKLFYSRKHVQLTADSNELEIPYWEPVVYSAMVTAMNRLQFDKTEIDRNVVLMKQTLQEAIEADAISRTGEQHQLKPAGGSKVNPSDPRKDPWAGWR
jgi:hypothetical protein